jgi:hypothetical protein
LIFESRTYHSDSRAEGIELKRERARRTLTSLVLPGPDDLLESVQELETQGGSVGHTLIMGIFPAV